MSTHIALADLPVSAQELETRLSEITTQARKESLIGAVTLTLIFPILRHLWALTYKISKYNHKF